MSTKYKAPALFFLALILAGVATFATLRYLQTKEAAIKAALEEGIQYTQIIVPLRNLEVGDIISTATVSARDVPLDYIPDSAIAADAFDSVSGMTVIEPVTYGRPLLKHQLKELSGVSRFSELLKHGQRAISINVDTLDTNAFMLKPGDIVDLVLLAGKKSKGSGGGKDIQVVPLLDRVTVLATDFITLARPPMGEELAEAGYGTITVGIDIKDVPLILQAREREELSYLLRHPMDEKPLKPGWDKEDLANIREVTVFAGGKAKNGQLVSHTIVSKPPVARVMDEEGNARIVKKFRGKPASKTEELQVIPAVELSGTE